MFVKPTAFSALIATLIATFVATPYGSAAAAADYYQISAGRDQVISEHNVCRIVRNRSGDTLHVPTRTDSEWHAWTASFLSNVGSMTGISAEPCIYEKVIIWSCRNKRTTDGQNGTGGQGGSTCKYFMYPEEVEERYGDRLRPGSRDQCDRETDETLIYYQTREETGSRILSRCVLRN